ncbi:hypothetical protein [Bacillus litorisediminis]|uniref:hypothetical protein n=1 Tax=Bacillus litorisediminis TaxID=2922713 RepID=UPI001FACF4AA|nr:hypothetical protein [Bacillus litorisediminis]
MEISLFLLTVVTVEIQPLESGANLRLTQAGFSDAESRDQHEEARTFVLEDLELVENPVCYRKT